MAYDTDSKLATINTNVTALGASTRLGAINATGRGTISIADAATSGTATITAVVTARTMVRFLGSIVQNVTTFTESQVRVDLTNTTTITASVGVAGAGARVLTVGYEYTEYAA